MEKQSWEEVANPTESFGHEHPPQLLTQVEQPLQEEVTCSRCREQVSASMSAPIYKCNVEQCGFYVHKKCGEAPSEMIHPLNPYGDPLRLLHQNYPGTWVCDFCDQEVGEKWIYYDFRGLNLDIKCALFTRNLAENNLQDLQHVALVYTTAEMSTDHHLGCCFACREPLTKSTYFSLDCGFNLHQKCAQLPIKINHVAHRKHPLLLQFNTQLLPCNICGTRVQGFVYTCLPCKFALHIECLSPPPIIEDISHHQHPFTLFRRHVPFICDACGTEGHCAAYICCTCNIMVHKKCTSLPRFIKHRLHRHRISHTYFLDQDEDFRSWDCIICHDEVNAKHGGYYCSRCKYTAHVKCALMDDDWYYEVSDDEDEDLPPLPPGESIDSITRVIEWNDRGEAAIVQHFKHIHNLVLSDRNLSTSDKYKCCDGCILPISSATFYYCSEYNCDFFLHKSCAELPKMKLIWTHDCQKVYLVLTSGNIFVCEYCFCMSNGFAYQCKECNGHVCLRCVFLTPDPLISPAHEHPLLFYRNMLDEDCHGCGERIWYRNYLYYCKACKFALDNFCATLPTIARHKNDRHLLSLTYRRENDYSECHYCDICEERRDPDKWFYHCATCYTSAHVKCVLGRYPFIKLGSTYEHEDHPHPLTFVKKMYSYPKCIQCGEACEDLALECAEPGCNHIVHWTCINPPDHSTSSDSFPSDSEE